MLIKWWTADSNASFGMYIGIYFMLGSLAVGAYFSAQWYAGALRLSDNGTLTCLLGSG